MTIYFHAASGSFYDTALHSDIPKDVKKVAATRYQKLVNDLCAGKQIAADDAGNPTSVEPEMLMSETQRLAVVRKRRDRLLSACDYIMMPDYPIAEQVRTNWAVYRQALRDLPTNFTGDLTALNWPTPPQTPSDLPT